MAGKLIIIEGNISAGKSCLARDLGRDIGCKVFLEPTNTNPYLENFYKDPKTYALPMQLWLLRQRFRTYVAAVRYILETGNGVILDRSVFSDWVFAEKNVQDGNISREGYNYYLALRQKMLSGLPAPHITLYLQVSAQRCYDRVHHMRGRQVESGIPLEYLSGLEDCYKAFLGMMEQIGSSVLTVNWQDFGMTQDVASGVKMAITGHWKSIDRITAMINDDAEVNRRMKMDAVERQTTWASISDDELDVDETTDSTVEESYMTPVAAARAIFVKE